MKDHGTIRSAPSLSKPTTKPTAIASRFSSEGDKHVPPIMENNKPSKLAPQWIGLGCTSPKKCKKSHLCGATSSFKKYVGQGKLYVFASRLRVQDHAREVTCVFGILRTPSSETTLAKEIASSISLILSETTSVLRILAVSSDCHQL